MAFGHEHDEQRRDRRRMFEALTLATLVGFTVLLRWPEPPPPADTATGAHMTAELSPPLPADS